eukprot:COSAG01_NODE_2144_length_8312_cov_22.048843_12_plen_59_part_00
MRPCEWMYGAMYCVTDPHLHWPCPLCGTCMRSSSGGSNSKLLAPLQHMDSISFQAFVC